MKNYILGLILFCGLGVVEVLNAQQELMSYTIDHVANAKQYNPAIRLEKRMEFSIGNYFTSFDITGPSLKDIGSVDNEVLKVSGTSFLAGLEKENLINLNSYFQTFNVAFKIKGIEIDFGHSLRQQTHLLYPKGLAELLIKGNGDFIGESIPLGINASMTSFHQLNLGLSAQTGGFSFGTNIKFLVGVFNLTTESNKLDFHTNDDVYQLELDADYVINSTGLFSIDIDDNITTDFESLKGFAFYDSNFGLALDFGAVYEMNDKWKFSGSVLDLGYISWTEKVDNYSLKKKVSFGGLKLEDLINSDEPVSVNDTLGSLLKFESTKNAYKSKLTSSVYLSAKYNLTEKLSFTGLYYGQQHINFSSSAIAVASHLQMTKFIGIGVIYSVRDGQADNFGISTNFSIGPVRLFYAMDNVLAVILPGTARHLNFRLGSSVVL